MRQGLVVVITLLCLVALVTTAGEGFASSATHQNQVVTSTITIGSTVSTSLSQPQQIFNASFTVLSTTGTKLQCEFWTFNFTANVGQFLSGGFSSDNPVSFFVVTQSTYQSWVAAGMCGNAGAAIASQLISTGYSFTGIAIPSSGTWTVVIVNASNAKNAEGSLTLSLSAGVYPVTQPLLSSLTTTITSSSVSGQSPGIDGFPFASIIIGLAVGLIAAMILKQRRFGRA